MLSGQLTLFDSTTVASTSLRGLQILLPTECQCGCNAVVLGSGKGPHLAEMFCVGCGGHRGWFSGKRAEFVNNILDHVGRPDTPIIIRQRG